MTFLKQKQISLQYNVYYALLSKVGDTESKKKNKTKHAKTEAEWGLKESIIGKLETWYLKMHWRNKGREESTLNREGICMQRSINIPRGVQDHKAHKQSWDQRSQEGLDSVNPPGRVKIFNPPPGPPTPNEKPLKVERQISPYRLHLSNWNYLSKFNFKWLSWDIDSGVIWLWRPPASTVCSWDKPSQLSWYLWRSWSGQPHQEAAYF